MQLAIYSYTYIAIYSYICIAIYSQLHIQLYIAIYVQLQLTFLKTENYIHSYVVWVRVLLYIAISALAIRSYSFLNHDQLATQHIAIQLQLYGTFHHSPVLIRSISLRTYIITSYITEMSSYKLQLAIHHFKCVNFKRSPAQELLITTTRPHTGNC